MSRLIVAVTAVTFLVLGESSETTTNRSLTVVEFSILPDSPCRTPNNTGIMRNADPPNVQFISQRLTSVKLPAGEKMDFLRLAYALEGPQTFNGWWIKTLGPKSDATDWSEYRDGSLVLRLSTGKICTSIFKLEIKTRQKPRGYFARVQLQRDQLEAIRKKGFVDVAVSLNSIVIGDDPLTAVTELNVTFERDWVTKERGILLINSIKLER